MLDSAYLPFAGFILFAALLWHGFIKEYGAAVLGSTLTTTVAFQGFTYFELGYLDPFFLLAILASLPLAAIGSSLVGLPFRIRRSRSIESEKSL